MKIRSPRNGLILLLVAIVAAGLGLAVVIRGSSTSAIALHTFPGKRGQEDVAGNRGEPDGAEGEESEKGGEDPEAYAEQQFAARAYPESDLPVTAALNAVQAWNQKSNGKKSAGQWTLAGPSIANYPGVLTFSGAEYTASGRVTALAVGPTCSTSNCRVWVGAAGGGVFRTDNALSGSGPNWTYVSGSFGTNAIGTLTYAGGVLYAGTGEPNASGDSEAGLGIWKSTNGGDTWTQLPAVVGPITTNSPGTGPNGTYTGNAFLGRSISAILVDPTNPNHLYVGSARGARGVSSVTGGAVTNPPTPRPPYGLFESTDGGATFSFIWDGSTGPMNGTTALASVRGVHAAALDPGFNGTTNRIVHAADFPGQGAVGGGVWRSADGGTTWVQIKTALNATRNTDRASFAVTALPNGDTRMYVGVGNDLSTAANLARVYRSDDVRTAVPVFTDLTTSQNTGYCGQSGGAQCWYDNVVYSPPGKPDVVYIGGSFSYPTFGFSTNGRAFIRSANAGASFTDMTWDATTNPTPPGNCCQPNPVAPNGQHPDSHAVIELPGSDAAIFGGDGGLMRSSGTFTDISAQCTTRAIGGANLALCQQLLSAVPSQLYNLNKGLSTLQFQSLSVAADNPKHLQGGTQDNGTFETTGSAVVWPQIVYGDGGQSGFNATNSSLRFNSFFGQNHDANFQNGDPTKWVIIGGPIASSPEGSNFYAPIIADPTPAMAGSIFEGSQSVWRTQDWGGNQAYLEANCPEFTTAGNNPACGDFVRIGPAGATDLTAAAADYRGATRAGGFVAAIERATTDTGTMWAATTTGRVFISKNADAPAGSVTYTRLDTLPSATADPNRFVSGISIDPANANHAWISYSGYSFNTPAQPGHVFSVTFNGSGDATWSSLDGTGTSAFPE
ncbi:MAG: WD40/YVTN/BNR-like repeat-containing protein, partial [Micromonosporaceae bacterium]